MRVMPRRSRRDSPNAPGGEPVRAGIVLWKIGNTACTCRTVDRDHIEITLTVDAVVVQSGWFDHHEEASRFAIALRRAFDTA